MNRRNRLWMTSKTTYRSDMNFIDEARKLAASPLVIYDSKTLRQIIAGLLQILIVERKQHADEVRDLNNDLNKEY